MDFEAGILPDGIQPPGNTNQRSFRDGRQPQTPSVLLEIGPPGILADGRFFVPMGRSGRLCFPTIRTDPQDAAQTLTLAGATQLVPEEDLAHPTVGTPFQAASKDTISKWIIKLIFPMRWVKRSELMTSEARPLPKHCSQVSHLVISSKQQHGRLQQRSSDAILRIP